MGKTVEQIYQKKSQHEHVLARPDMYIGSIEPITDDIWVYDEAENIMKQRKATWTPGLYKIFDEILVNAADNKVRDPAGQTVIKVRINRDSVQVYNNGEGIPVQKHKEHNLWIPEMIFGHLLTSSNYDDAEAKVTGGRNGYGAKLTNVFSRKFTVETVHSRSRKKFFMQWRDNMWHHDDPVITPSDSPDYTMVTFWPDFTRFHEKEFTEDMILLMKRRVYDVAGCTDKSLKCYLNGQRIAISTFAEYIDLYPTMGEERHKASYSRVNPRWEVCVRVSNLGFQQVSFVNSICTSRGGTHVKYILDQIVTRVTDAARKKSKTEVKPHMIRPHIFLFINCLIENPGFDSQTKETLTTVKGKFGSTCDIPNSMIDYILRSGIVERSIEMANSKLTKEIASKLRTADRKQITGIPKLDDANEAGGRNSQRCTLILTEGDSAKTLCTAGLAVKDRDYFGVFPLRGKPLNVRDASLKKVMECEEIQCVMKIMGLDLRQKYTSSDGLRYGHLMIMADQDHDGSHIKGLIINMIHFYWPSLLRVPGFLQQFITPIVKAWPKGRGKSGNAISFFSMPDYLEWKQSMGENVSKYEIRYYKGLGTSGAKEGREYFENIERHRLDFEERGPQDADRIAMAFAKDRVEERKEWITHFKTNVNPNETMDYTVRKVSYGEFVDKELILFSVADCERSIPSVIDGFKPGQRKILFSCFKRRLAKSIKVMQLAGYVSEHSAYHHGEQSLVQTIVAMAQNFVGSNNVPLLQQDGQFGTRLQGGKDHAAGRYIFTHLSPLTRFIFHPADEYIVEYKDDDGLSVEPFYYMPIIPMVLINGTSGIGTGFSTNIPNYNPVEVVDNLLRLMHGEEMVPMKPWYFGFIGTIEEREKGKFVSRGRYEVRPDGVVSITELPVNVWTQNYKRFIEDLREKEIVVQYREHNTDVTVDFELFVHPQILQHWIAQDVVEDKLQLREFVHATNIIAFDREGQITKYLDAEAVMKEFYLIRLEYYAKRKDYLLGELRRMTNKLENMARFVREVVNGTLVITRRKKRELLEELRRRKYTPLPPHSSKKLSATTIDANDADDEAAARAAADEDNDEDGLRQEWLLRTGSPDAPGRAQLAAEEPESAEVQRASREYDYLLGMKLWSLTAEMIARLEEQLRRAKNDIADLEKRSPKELWIADLKDLRPRLVEYFNQRAKEIAGIQRKKLEKKKPFDVRRLRVPILSDKVRNAMAKEAEKLRIAATKASLAVTSVGKEGSATPSNRTTATLFGAASEAGKTATSDGPSAPAVAAAVAAAGGKRSATTRAQARPAARRRRRKGSSSSSEDDDVSLEDWVSDEPSEDGRSRGRSGSRAGSKSPSRSSSKGGSGSRARNERSAASATRSPARGRSGGANGGGTARRRSPSPRAAPAATARGRPRKREKKEPVASRVKAAPDDFDLDGFGLEALGLPASPTIKCEPAVTAARTAARASRSKSPSTSVVGGGGRTTTAAAAAAARGRSTTPRDANDNRAANGSRSRSNERNNKSGTPNDDEEDDLKLLGLAPVAQPRHATPSRSRSASAAPARARRASSASPPKRSRSPSSPRQRSRSSSMTRSKARGSSKGATKRPARTTARRPAQQRRRRRRIGSSSDDSDASNSDSSRSSSSSSSDSLSDFSD